MKTYKELMTLPTFEDRFHYLENGNKVGDPTFGYDRWLNQKFYTSPEWRRIRRIIAIRDDGDDLGCEDHPIYGRIHVHHIEPITKEDILNRADCVLDPNNLVTVSYDTHQIIHYGYTEKARPTLAERKPYDTCPWRT